MLVIQPKPSKQLKVCLIVIHLIASLSLFLLPFWAGYLSFFMISMSLYQSWLSQFIQPKITTVILKNDLDCTLYSKTLKNADFSAQLLHSTVITPLFILFHFKDQQQQFYAKLIWVDSLTDSLWRQLQVALKIQHTADD